MEEVYEVDQLLINKNATEFLLLPSLVQHHPFDNELLQMFDLKGVYIKDHGIEFNYEDAFILVFKYDIKKGTTGLDNLMKKYPEILLDYYFSADDELVVVVSVNPEILELFTQGRYSEMYDRDFVEELYHPDRLNVQYKLLLKNRYNPSMASKIIAQRRAKYGIFTKSEKYRTALSRLIGTKIPKDAELFPALNYKKEIYRFNPAKI